LWDGGQPKGRAGITSLTWPIPASGSYWLLASAFPADVTGVAIDTYHVWWDSQLAELLG
jgi:hypothetical protein